MSLKIDLNESIEELHTLEIQVDDAQMEAWVDISAGGYVSIERVKQEIYKQGIRFGLRLSALRELLLPSQQDRRIILARGQLRVDGMDGHLQMQVESALPYSIREDGSYDYHGVSQLQTVDAGTCIATVIDPSRGALGMTVKGVSVHPHHGLEFHGSTVVGEGTRLQDDGEILAQESGVFSKSRDGKLQVTEQLIIDGDVDLSVGNIETDKPVVIHGDIKSGFVVKSEADITVHGVIEDSRVSAGGKLIVEKGILPGKQRIKAHGELCAKYIQERRIECRDIVVESIIRHSHVSARGSVHAQSIIGGSLSAGKTITVGELGNQGGEPTSVRVGVDDYVLACVDKVRAEKIDLVHQRHLLQEEFDTVHKQTLALTGSAQDLAQRQAPRHIVNAAVQKAQAATRLREEKQEMLAVCDHDIEICNQSIECEKAHVRGIDHASIEVTGDVHPGVEIGFGTLKKKNIISVLTAVKFHCLHEEIVVRL